MLIELGYFDLVDDVEKLGIVNARLFYRELGLSITERLRELHDDKQVLEMLEHMEDGMIEVYVDGSQQTTAEVASEVNKTNTKK